jgi:hypothetical protein
MLEHTDAAIEALDSVMARRLGAEQAVVRER